MDVSCFSCAKEGIRPVPKCSQSDYDAFFRCQCGWKISYKNAYESNLQSNNDRGEMKMNNDQQAQPNQPSKSASLKDVEAVRDLFARAHDYIAQANHPGHLGMKVAEVLNFLSFQYNDFKLRAEKLAATIEADAKAELSKVDVEAAKAAVETTLAPEQPKA